MMILRLNPAPSIFGAFLLVKFLTGPIVTAEALAWQPDLPCTIETEAADCGGEATFLYCNATTLTCQCGGTQYFDYFDGQCYKPGGSYCGGLSDNCTPNSFCFWNNCVCYSTHVSDKIPPKNNKCVKKMGENCTEDFECDRESFMICRPNESSQGGTCACNGTRADSAIFDPVTQKCVLNLNEPCQTDPWTQPCPSIGASCREGKCLCDGPFSQNGHGQCRLALGQPCEGQGECDEYNFLICGAKTGQCECDKGQGLVVDDRGICVRAGLDSCGGLLESEGGDLEFPLDHYEDGNHWVIKGGSICMWIVKVGQGQGIDLTLNSMGNGTTLLLYPEHQPSDTNLTPVIWTSSNAGDKVKTAGQTITVILMQDVGVDTADGFSVSWESSSASPTGEQEMGGVTAANYFDIKEGRINWKKLGLRERGTVALNLPLGYSASVKASTDFPSCDLTDPCLCTYFALYEVLQTTGQLREVTRICGHSSNVEFTNLLPQLVAFVHVGNLSEVIPAENRIQLSWHSTV